LAPPGNFPSWVLTGLFSHHKACADKFAVPFGRLPVTAFISSHFFSRRTGLPDLPITPLLCLRELGIGRSPRPHLPIRGSAFSFPLTGCFSMIFRRRVDSS